MHSKISKEKKTNPKRKGEGWEKESAHCSFSTFLEQGKEEERENELHVSRVQPFILESFPSRKSFCISDCEPKKS